MKTHVSHAFYLDFFENSDKNTRVYRIFKKIMYNCMYFYRNLKNQVKMAATKARELDKTIASMQLDRAAARNREREDDFKDSHIELGRVALTGFHERQMAEQARPPRISSLVFSLILLYFIFPLESVHGARFFVQDFGQRIIQSSFQKSETGGVLEEPKISKQFHAIEVYNFFQRLVKKSSTR